MRFVLYSRPGCGLCEEMRTELDRLPAAQGYPLEVLDVESLGPGARSRGRDDEERHRDREAERNIRLPNKRVHLRTHLV